MQKKSFILTVLLTGLSTLLYGQLTISPTTLPDGTYGGTYNQQLTGNGGALGPLSGYSFSLDPASLPLPANLSISPSGVISGSLTAAAGSYTFTVDVTDLFSETGQQIYTLTIDPATLTVTAVSATTTYGSAIPALTVGYSGFVNGDDASVVTTQPTASTTATQGSPAGGYTITPGGGVSSNYTFNYVNGTLTIGDATLTVTANSFTRLYGDPNPTFTGTITGGKDGDTFT